MSRHGHEPGPALRGWAAALVLFPVGVYLLLCGAAALYLIIDVWSERFLLLEASFPGLKEQIRGGDLDKGFLKTLTYTIAGSMIGAVIISFQGLHRHGAVERDFRASYVGSYLIGPWAASLLGVVVYGLVRGGLFLFGGSSDLDGPSQATQFGYLGLGALTGFAWEKVLRKMGELADQVLGIGDSKTSDRTRTPGDQAQGDGVAPTTPGELGKTGETGRRERQDE